MIKIKNDGSIHTTGKDANYLFNALRDAYKVGKPKKITRKEIEQKIQEKVSLIDNTKLEIIELERNALLLSDSEQWFEEKVESHPKRKWARKENYLDGKLVGRIFWNENFIDEDTGDVVTIERQQVVRINGEWV